MRTHTSDFKTKLPLLGREIDFKMNYTENGINKTIEADDLNSASLHYKGSILKSVMKQLDIDTNVEIPLETVLTCQFGLKINKQYEYINLGKFVVYSIEKNEDMNSFTYVCYDKILYSMKDYEAINGVSYPITIKNYLIAICNYLGITFDSDKNANFANYNKTISKELYLSEEGTSLGYTFRDVLDEIAQATGSTICINDDDKLEVRYINNTNDTIDEEYLNDTNVNFGDKFGPINTIVLSRSGGDKIYKSNPEDLTDEDKIAIEIENNQIMNFDNRDEFLPAILDKLYGLEFYECNYTSKGIVYYELCDKYNVKVGDKTYSCIMFEDETNINQGLEEFVNAEKPETSQPDYTKADKTDRRINQVIRIADKQNGTITDLVRNFDDINKEFRETQRVQTAYEDRFEVLERNIDSDGNILAVKTLSGFVFNESGLNLYTGENSYNTQITNTGTFYYDGNNLISSTTKDGFLAKDFRLINKHYYSFNNKYPDDLLNVENYDFVDERIEVVNEETGVTEYPYATFYNGEE